MSTTLSVNAVETNLTYFRGTDHQFVMTDANAADMDGWDLSFMVKKAPTDADVDAKLHYTSTPSDGVSIATSVATVTVAADDTRALTPGLYFWELKRRDAQAETVLGFGQFKMLRAVHKEA